MRNKKPVCITQIACLPYKTVFEMQFLIVDHLKSVMFSFCVQIFIHKTKIQYMRTNCTLFYMYIIHKTKIQCMWTNCTLFYMNVIHKAVTGKYTLTTNFNTPVLVKMLPFALLSESSEWYHCSKLSLNTARVTSGNLAVHDHGYLVINTDTNVKCR